MIKWSDAPRKSHFEKRIPAKPTSARWRGNIRFAAIGVIAWGGGFIWDMQKAGAEQTWSYSGTAAYPTAVATPGKARSVRLELIGEGWLHLAEVEVWGWRGSSGVPENLALGQPAFQSSTAENGRAGARRAVDGNPDGNYAANSVSHTNKEYGPWWEVDLGEICHVQEVRIWNRSDAVPERLQNFQIRLSANPAASATIMDFPTGSGLPGKSRPSSWGYLRLPIFGMSLLLAAWAVHLLWWNIRLPRNQNGALLIIGASVMIFGTALALMLPRRLNPVKDFWELWLLLSFYAPLALTYISLYSLLEERSPTLTLIADLSRAGQKGCEKEALLESMTKQSDQLLARRLEIMERDRLIERSGSAVKLTPKGRMWGGIFSLAARVLGLKLAQ